MKTKEEKIIKQHVRKNGQIVKQHIRKTKSSTFNKGYRKAIRDVFCEFREIGIKESRYYWRWNLFGSFIKAQEKKG